MWKNLLIKKAMSVSPTARAVCIPGVIPGKQDASFLQYFPPKPNLTKTPKTPQMNPNYGKLYKIITLQNYQGQKQQLKVSRSGKANKHS